MAGPRASERMRWACFVCFDERKRCSAGGTPQRSTPGQGDPGCGAEKVAWRRRKEALAGPNRSGCAWSRARSRSGDDRVGHEKNLNDKDFQSQLKNLFSPIYLVRRAESGKVIILGNLILEARLCRQSLANLAVFGASLPKGIWRFLSFALRSSASVGRRGAAADGRTWSAPFAPRLRKLRPRTSR